MIERRSEPRAVTGLAGTARTVAGISAGCTVVNLSPGGAHLAPTGDARLPDRFSVSLGGGTASLPVRVVWRQGRNVGVAFVERRQVPPVLDV